MTPLKIAILVMMFLMIVSLITAGIFLSKDKGKKRSKRTLYALGARVTCAIILLLLVSYGLYTGELRSNAPWSYVPIEQNTTTPANTAP